MTQKTEIPPIPRAAALKLCREIRKQYHGKFWTFSALQCWGCVTFSGGNEAKMSVSSRPDYNGCKLVTARFRKRGKAVQ